MRTIPILAAALLLPGCTTIARLAVLAAPTASIAVNERVAEHCVRAAQSGAPVDQRHQVRADFAGIAYDTEIRNRTTAAQQAGVDEARRLRRAICPPVPVAVAVEPGAP